MKITLNELIKQLQLSAALLGEHTVLVSSDAEGNHIAELDSISPDGAGNLVIWPSHN